MLQSVRLQLYDILKKSKSGCEASGGEGEQEEQRGFLGQQNYSAVCDPIMVDTCCHTFVKSLWMYSTKTKL